MNRIINRAKKNIISQKKKYLFLFTILLVGIFSGIIFIFFISKTDKLLVKDEMNIFFKSINDNKLNYTSSLVNSILSNVLYLIIIWILGISIIGIPIIIFILFLKGFIFGFNISAIIYNFGVKGIPLAIFYQFPHNIILLLIFILISFYSISFSMKLFRFLFIKEKINLDYYFRRYNQITIICLIGFIICSLIEVFLSPILLGIFL